MTRRLVIVRHGRTAHNADGRFQGHLDTQLDEVGMRQAIAVTGELAGYQPSKVVASDSARAADTAAPLAQRIGVAVHLDKRLREVDMGAWTGLTADEARAAFPREYTDWSAGVDTARGGGETFATLGDRAAAAVADHLTGVSREGTLVVVTHGGTARALTGRLLELPWEWCWRLGVLGNTRRAVLLETTRGWRLSEYNAGPAAH